MKQLQFTKRGRLRVAEEKGISFAIWPGTHIPLWCAKWWVNGTKQGQTREDFLSRAEAIDWLAKHRKPASTEADHGQG
jgi:hypothetical protein